MSNTLYDKNNVLVDGSRYMVKGTMYPINSIASVCAYKHDKGSIRRDLYDNWVNTNASILQDLKNFRNKTVFFALLGALALYLFTNTFGVSVFSLSLAVLLYAIYKLSEFQESEEPSGPKDSYSVKISTSAGETDSYQSFNENEIESIVSAINESVLARG